MTEEMKKNLQTTQRRMMRMIIQTNRKFPKGPAGAHAANAEEVADDEPHDPEYEQPEEDTTEINPQDPSEQEERKQDADDRVPQGELEDALESWVEQPTRQTTCWLQMEPRRGSSDTAGFFGNKQE